MKIQKAAIVAVVCVLLTALSSGAGAAPKPSPDQSIELLRAGNARFVAGTSQHPNTTAERLRQAGRENQGDHAYATEIN